MTKNQSWLKHKTKIRETNVSEPLRVKDEDMPRRIVERLQRRLLRSSFYFCSIRVFVTYTIHTQSLDSHRTRPPLRDYFLPKCHDRGFSGRETVGMERGRIWVIVNTVRENQKGGRGKEEEDAGHDFPQRTSQIIMVVVHSRGSRKSSPI